MNVILEINVWEVLSTENEKSKLWALKDQNVGQPTYTCSKLTIETLEEGVKYVQS